MTELRSARARGGRRFLRLLPILVAGFAVLACLTSAPAVRAADEEEATTLVYPPFGHCLGIHRATAFHLFVYLGTRTKFDEPAGLAAVKLIEEDDPETDSDDDELTVFGLNSGECEIIFNTSLVSVEIYGERGSGPGQFSSPLGIAADERGTVFVADTGNDRVVRLQYHDDDLHFVKAFGSSGDAPGQFSSPSQIALGASGTVYVTDTGNDRVVTMSPVGEEISIITGDPAAGIALEGPIGLAVVEAEDAWITRKRDFFVVADREGSRLIKMSRDGSVHEVIEAGEGPLEDARFDYLAIDFYGNIYATDRRGGRIHKFTWTLAHVTSVGRQGDGDMEFDEPRGITLWRRFGQIFVTERGGAQYFWIGTDILELGVEPRAFVPLTEHTIVTYMLTETARVTIELLDDDGEPVHTLVDDRRRAIGENIERWNGATSRRAGAFPAGRYTLRLTATPTYSSGAYFHDTAEISIELLPARNR